MWDIRDDIKSKFLEIETNGAWKLIYRLSLIFFHAKKRWIIPRIKKMNEQVRVELKPAIQISIFVFEVACDISIDCQSWIVSWWFFMSCCCRHVRCLLPVVHCLLLILVPIKDSMQLLKPPKFQFSCKTIS